MFLRTFELRKTPLYLYANSDILFDSTLVTTVRSLLCVQRSLRNNPPPTEKVLRLNQPTSSSQIGEGIFAVGRRVNVNAADVSSVTPRDVSELLRGRTLFEGNAQDYFLTTSPLGLGLQTTTTETETESLWTVRDTSAQDVEQRNANVNSSNSANIYTGHFPWHDILDFVIGRPGYDNWLVIQAIKWNVTWSIDLSLTIHALHQTGPEGVLSGWNTPEHKTTLYVNRKMAGKKYNYNMGRTYCLPWLSTLTMEGHLVIIHREALNVICFKPFQAPKKARKGR